MNPKVGAVVFYTGRLLQALAMWVLLVDIFMAGPMGPEPNPFYAEVVMFIAGWLLVRAQAAKVLGEAREAKAFNGLIKLLAVARKSRSSFFPEIPTTAEAGGPELDVKSWLSLIVPRDTPPEIIARINKDFSNMMSTPAIQERLRVVGFTSEVGGPDDLTRTMREDMARNSELIKRTGASAQ